MHNEATGSSEAHRKIRSDKGFAAQLVHATAPRRKCYLVRKKRGLWQQTTSQFPAIAFNTSYFAGWLTNPLDGGSEMAAPSMSMDALTNESSAE
jgi:hypothetical protein